MAARSRDAIQRNHDRARIAQLYLRGYSQYAIAEELGLSVRSVGNHLAKIYNKLHIHGRSEAVLYAIRTGIATVD